MILEGRGSWVERPGNHCCRLTQAFLVPQTDMRSLLCFQPKPHKKAPYLTKSYAPLTIMLATFIIWGCFILLFQHIIIQLFKHVVITRANGWKHPEQRSENTTQKSSANDSTRINASALQWSRVKKYYHVILQNLKYISLLMESQKVILT